ncbi:MAG: VOC family protein [Stackebrandtia sp.]
MTSTDKPATVPPGYTTVTPWFAVKGVAKFFEFLAEAFGAEEINRVSNPDGSIGHAETRIGDAIVMSFDIDPASPDFPALTRLFVPDASQAAARAVDAGCVLVTEPTELFWGDKVGRVRDPWGNLWWLQERVAEVDPDEMAQRAADPEHLAAMKYVQDSAATELARTRPLVSPAP